MPADNVYDNNYAEANPEASVESPGCALEDARNLLVNDLLDRLSDLILCPGDAPEGEKVDNHHRRQGGRLVCGILDLGAEVADHLCFSTVELIARYNWEAVEAWQEQQASVTLDCVILGVVVWGHKVPNRMFAQTMLRRIWTAIVPAP